MADSLDKQIQNEKELIHLAGAGVGVLFFVCVESINLTWLFDRARALRSALSTAPKRSK